MENLKETIRGLIGNAKTKIALETMSEHPDVFDSNTVSLLKSRFTTNNSARNTSITSSREVNMENAQINYSILTMLGNLDGAAPISKTIVQQKNPQTMQKAPQVRLREILQSLRQMQQDEFYNINDVVDYFAEVYTITQEAQFDEYEVGLKATLLSRINSEEKAQKYISDNIADALELIQEFQKAFKEEKKAEKKLTLMETLSLFMQQPSYEIIYDVLNTLKIASGNLADSKGALKEFQKLEEEVCEIIGEGKVAAILKLRWARSENGAGSKIVAFISKWKINARNTLINPTNAGETKDSDLI